VRRFAHDESRSAGEVIGTGAVRQRFSDVLPWTGDAGPAAGTTSMPLTSATGAVSARDVWQHTTATYGDAISEQLPAHGSALFRVRRTHQQ
jgi:Alpha galactosidase C-terminal beta sandwich domain